MRQKKLHIKILYFIIFIIVSTPVFAQKSIENQQYEMLFREFNVIGASEYGYKVEIIGDFNGDSFDDFIVASPKMTQNSGICDIYYGGENYDTIPDLTLVSPYLNAEFGSSVAAVGDVNNDGFDDILIGAPAYASSKGAAFLYLGDNEPNEQPHLTYYGANPEDYFGSCVASIDDVNADGIKDFAIGAYGHLTNRGIVYCFKGKTNLSTTPDLVVVGESVNSYFGYEISSAGDFNNDSYNDIVIAATNYNGTGKLYFYGGFANFPDGIIKKSIIGELNSNFGFSIDVLEDIDNNGFNEIAVSSVDFNNSTGKVTIYESISDWNDTPNETTITNNIENSFFGHKIISEDINSDGFTDLLISSIGNENISGKVEVYYGGADFDTYSDLTIEGEETHDLFGFSMSCKGDLNNDNINDLIIGSKRFNDNRGKIYIFHGSENFDNQFHFSIIGQNTNNLFGVSCDNIGDFNGDGIDDIAIGADGFNNYRGRVYIYFGGIETDMEADLILSGVEEYEHFGYNLAGVGDINNDGFDDLLIGSYGKNNGEGEAYIFLGSENPDNEVDLILSPETTLENFATTLSAAGDYNNDGFADFVIGAYGFPNGNNNGRAYLYFGGEELDNEADMYFDGVSENTKLAYCVSSAGDVNNDGISDLLIGRSSDSGKGNAYIYFGAETPDNVYDVYFNGEIDGDKFGRFVSDLGDINNDGFDDVAVVAPEFGNKGKVFIYFGGNPMNNLQDFSVIGTVNYNQLGKFVNRIGDINDDSIEDFAIYSPEENGKIFVWYGNENMTSYQAYDFVIEGDKLKGDFGTSFANAGNFSAIYSNSLLSGANFAGLNGEAYFFNGFLTHLFFQNQSGDISSCEGIDTLLFVDIHSVWDLEFQWYKSTDGGEIFQIVENETNDTIFFENISHELNENIFKCSVTGNNETVYCEPITLFIDQFIEATSDEDFFTCEASEIQLNANEPESGFGFWTSNNENIIFSSSTSYSTMVYNFPYDEVIFTWTITNGLCQSSTSTLVTFQELIYASVGEDENTCETESYTVYANNPSIGTGVWTSTDENVIFENINASTTTITNFEFENTTFTWTITNGTCIDEASYNINFHQPISILQQPQSQEVTFGETTILEVDVLGEVINYQWVKNGIYLIDGANISGSNTNELTVANISETDLGNYNVTIDGYCNDLFSNEVVIYLQTIGIDELSSDLIKIYPNPFIDKIIIDINDKFAKEESNIYIEILNISGEKILAQKVDKQYNKIKLISLNSGIYILNIISENRILTRKIICVNN